MILTTPLFKGLKQIFPKSRISVLASRNNSLIPNNSKEVDAVYIYYKNLFKSFNLITNLKKQKFDLIIDTKFSYSRTSKYIIRLLKSVKSMGYNFEEKVFDISLNEFKKGEHTLDINLTPLFYFNNNFLKGNFRPELNIPIKSRDKYATFFRNTNLKNVLINISAGNKIRYWKISKWIELINLIPENYNIILTAMIKDNKTVEIILDNVSKNIKYFPTYNIFDVAECVKNSNLVITPDTSVIHVAGCYNKPVIGLYNNVEWNLKRYAPISEINRVIISNDKEKIEDIETENVFNKFKELENII